MTWVSSSTVVLRINSQWKQVLTETRKFFRYSGILVQEANQIIARNWILTWNRIINLLWCIKKLMHLLKASTFFCHYGRVVEKKNWIYTKLKNFSSKIIQCPISPLKKLANDMKYSLANEDGQSKRQTQIKWNYTIESALKREDIKFKQNFICREGSNQIER